MRLASLLLACSLTLYGGVASIWAVGDGEKVERDDLAHPLKKKNTVWDGRTIRVFGARNEIIAFQVIVEADAKGIGALTATMPPMKEIPAPQLFSVNYMLIEKPTQAGWIYRPNTPGAPRDVTGWKPVQLVPSNAKPGRGGFPLKVAANNGQAIWIEIYTGRRLAAGVYRSTVTLQADGATVDVPLELTVFDFDLPDENSMHAMFFYGPDQVKLYHGRDLDPEYHRFAHRNRVEFVHAYDETTAERNRGRFDGSDFSAAKGYEGPGQNTGNRIVPRTFYGPGRDFEKQETAWPKADSWMNYVAKYLPRAITFLYLPDEPYPSQYERVRELGRMLHANPGPGGKLRTFLTHEYTKELDGAADIWCSGPQGFKIDRVKTERARGRDYWIYNGGRPYGGAVVIDSPATDPRALIWGSFKHDIDLYFYWYANHWRHNTQKQGERNQDVWANPVTFDNRGQPNKPVQHQSFANGDGVLVYPGEDVLHPDQDRGVPGPISTVQMANFRRGLQDHQYLTIARKRGLATVVTESLQQAVPRMFSDASETVGFAESGEVYESARLKLARAIVKASKQ